MRGVKRPAVVAIGAFLIAMTVAAFGLRSFLRPSITGDGVGYYAPLASLLVDGDLDLRNEVAHLSRAYLRAAFMTPEGALGNPFPVGPAHLWAPAVLMVRALPPGRVDAPLELTPTTRHPAFAPRYARALAWTNLLLVAWAGAVLCAVLAGSLGATVAVVAVCAGILGTPTFFYAMQDPSYGHTASFFAVSLYVGAILLDRRKRLPPEILGAALGLVMLMRSQDALLGTLLLPRLWDAWRTTSRRNALVVLLRLALPAVVMFAPQMFFWKHIYGRMLLVPPGPDFLPWWKPHLPHLLVSTWNGAFLWSPVLLLGLAGLWWTPDRALRTAFFAAVVLELYSSSVLLDWWGGRAFGARRLISLAPLAVVGLGFVMDRLRGARRRWAWAIALVALACVWNLRLATHYRNGLLPGNPGNAREYVRHPGLGPEHATPYGPWDHPRLFRELWRAERIRGASARR